MSPAFACVVGIVVYFGSRRWRNDVAVVAAVAVATFLVFPPVAVLGFAFWAVAGGWRRLRARQPPGSSREDLPLLVDLTGLGLSAGMTFPAAVAAGADQIGGPLGAEVRDTLRRRTSEATSSADGSTVTAGLFAVVDRALVTGAPMLPAVTGYGEALHADERHRRTAGARRLPVKLLFPLALLILPGFLVLTVGPALLAGLERMGL